MENSLILAAFDSSGWIRYNKKISLLYGLEASVMLGFLIDKYIYWSGYDKGSSRTRFEVVTGKLFEGEFFCIREDIEDELGISAHIQRKGLNALRNKGLIGMVQRGIPSKVFYSIDFSQVEKILKAKALTDLRAGCEQIEQLGVNRFDGNNNKDKEQKNNNNPIIIIENEKRSCAKAPGSERQRSTRRSSEKALNVEDEEVLDIWNKMWIEWTDEKYVPSKIDILALKHLIPIKDKIYLWPQYVKYGNNKWVKTTDCSPAVMKQAIANFGTYCIKNSMSFNQKYEKGFV